MRPSKAEINIEPLVPISNAIVLAKEAATITEVSTQEVGHRVKRVGGDYLADRLVQPTGNRKADETLWACFKSACTGRFLTLADDLITSDNGVKAGAKDNLVNECANTGLISALMLTIIVPLSFENLSDWLEEDYVGSGYAFVDGFIGQRLSEAQSENALAALHDLSLIFYAVGIIGFLNATVTTICVLLCVGELSTDAGCAEWLKRVGHVTRAPYLLSLSACAFTASVIVRWALSVKTLLGLIVLSVMCLTGLVLVVGICNVYIAGCIRAHNRIHEFEDLNLSQSEAQEDVEAWWKQNAKIDGTLQDCLNALAGLLKDPEKKHTLVISLNGISKQQVALHYHKLRAESLGITLLASELYNLSLQ